MFQLLILTELILISFVPKTLIYLQRNFWEVFILIYNMIWLELLPFQLICILESLSRHPLKPVQMLCEQWTTNFDFPHLTLDEEFQLKWEISVEHSLHDCFVVQKLSLVFLKSLYLAWLAWHVWSTIVRYCLCVLYLITSSIKDLTAEYGKYSGQRSPLIPFDLLCNIHP